MFKAGVEYQSWQSVENAILAGDYGVISNLKLTINGKTDLLNFCHREIEPYLYSRVKTMNYKDEMEYTLISGLLGLRLANRSHMNDIITFVQEIL